MNSLHLYSLHHSNSSSLNSSILKQSRSNNPSPKPADRINLKSPPATSRGKSRPRPNSICGNASLEKQYQEPRASNAARNLAYIKESHAILKEEHLLLRNDMFGFIQHLREAFEQMEQGHISKGFSQSAEKIHRLISELDETKFGSKKLVQERDNKIKELNFIIMEKEQEITVVHKYQETARRELKEREKTILRLEKTLLESKRKYQQEIDKIENERVSIENHYLKELQALSSRREYQRERPTLQTYREREREREPATTSRTRGNAGRSTDRVDSLIQEIEALRNDKENLNLQIHKNQEKHHNTSQENENLRRTLSEKQDLLRETKKQVDFLTAEIENSLNSRSKLQNQLNSSASQMEEMISQLNLKNKQIEQLRESQADSNNSPTLQANPRIRNSTNNLLTKSIESDREFHALKKETSKPNPFRRKESASTQSILSHRDSLYKSRVSMPSSREHSPKRAIATGNNGGMTARNSINLSLREKDLQEKIADLEKVQRNHRTKNESLQTENTNLLRKISFKEKDIVSLKQEIQSLKDKNKKTAGSVHLEKLVKEYENDLRKAKDEIHKLNLIRDGLETIIRGKNLDDDDDEDELVKPQKIAQKDSSRKTSPAPLGKKLKIPSLTLTPAPISTKYESSKNSLQRNNVNSPSSDIIINEVGGVEEDKMIGDFATKREGSLRATSTQRSYLSDNDDDDDLLDQDEIDKLRAENYQLNVELTAKNTKLQNLLRMSTVSMKNLANEFLKLASNIFADVNEKVQKETEKWEDFEKLVRKLILKHMHAKSETPSQVKPLEKKNLPQPQMQIQKREERLAPKTHRIQNSSSAIPEKEKTAIRKSLESKIWVTPLPTPTLSASSSRSNLKQNNLNDSKTKNSLDTKNHHSFKSTAGLQTSTVKKTVTKNSVRHERGKSYSGNLTARFDPESRPELEESRSTEKLESSRSMSQLVSPRQSESDTRKKAEEGTFGLKNLLEEMKNLRNSVVQNNSLTSANDPTLSSSQTSLSEQLKNKQKIIEMFENILNTEKGDRSDLEDIRELEQETDTLQDEVSFEQSYDIKGDGMHYVRFKN